MAAPTPDTACTPRGPSGAWFGGATFAFQCGEGAQLDALPMEAAAVPGSLPRVAHIVCERFDRTLALPRLPVRWRWDGDAATAQGTPEPASLRRLGVGRYVARFQATELPEDLLMLLLWPALLREGGLVLHACVVELPGAGVVAFLGPSGAGKTTAATLASGARLFAKDLAAVFPAGGRIWVAPLPGGSAPPPMPLSASRCLPLRAALRVVQSRGDRHRLEHLSSGPAAAATVLAAARHGATTLEDYTRLLDSADAVASAVSIGRVHTVLGQDLTPVLRDLWEQQS